VTVRTGRRGAPGRAPEWLSAFRSAGRSLVSFGLVKGAEGNLSSFDGHAVRITRTGAPLGTLGPADVLDGGLEGLLPGASSDLEVHRAIYRDRGPGAVAHAHPAGSVPEAGNGPGRHGVYVFATRLDQAVAEAVRRARAVAVSPIDLQEDGVVRLLDQRALPAEERTILARNADEVVRAIRSLAIRGAPLLGVAAAYGLAAEAVRSEARGPKGLLLDLERAGKRLKRSRPTAVNVAWAVDRVLGAARPAMGAGLTAVRVAVVSEARTLARQNQASCMAIGLLGADLVPAGANILTHCNTGALATGGAGTAQAVITTAHDRGTRVHVWVDETRPVLQGARLTAWELRRLGVPLTVLADSAAGWLMSRGQVDLVVVGADRIAANGDVANKIGTYPLAVLAGRHAVPFYVAAPASTVDPDTPTGEGIVIENRNPDEVTAPFGIPVVPAGTWALNPAFDVTPAELITAIITDAGVARPPYRASLRRALRTATIRRAEDEPRP
jgi:methylthioribose-1-phosphate isomerase